MADTQIPASTAATLPTLTDTPDWSPARRTTIQHTLWYGMALILFGATGSLWHMTDTIAQAIVNSGTTLMLAATGLHIGGASAERISMWLMKGLPPRDPRGERDDGCK